MVRINGGRGKKMADNRKGLFFGGLFGSGGGFLLLVLTNFGGWYNYYYYQGVRTWNYIGIGSPVSVLGLVILGIPFLFCFVTTAKGFLNPNSVTPASVSLAFKLSIVQLIIIVIGAVVFVVAVSGSDDWWFGTGFYGSFVGAVLAVIFLSMLRKSGPASVVAQYPYQQAGTQNIYSAPQSAQKPYAMYQQPYVQPQQPTQPFQPIEAKSQRFCSNCGATITDGARFCEKCGKAIQ